VRANDLRKSALSAGVKSFPQIAQMTLIFRHHYQVQSSIQKIRQQVRANDLRKSALSAGVQN